MQFRPKQGYIPKIVSTAFKSAMGETRMHAPGKQYTKYAIGLQGTGLKMF